MTDGDLTPEMIHDLRCEALDCDDTQLAHACEVALTDTRPQWVCAARRRIVEHLNAIATMGN